MRRIDNFRGNYYFLSNFYPVAIRYNWMVYGNAEAAFQAQKVLTDAERRPFISMSATNAKKYGRKVKLRPDWEDVKLVVMYDIVLAKFTQNPSLKEMLIATGNAELVEGNTWGDRYWGVCNGTGSNYLGKILMAVREQLR